jgi:hypothetical protein
LQSNFLFPFFEGVHHETDGQRNYFSSNWRKLLPTSGNWALQKLARQTFKQEYGYDYLDVGVGRLIEIE